MIDIVCPAGSGNFEEMAKNLGYDSLCFMGMVPKGSGLPAYTAGEKKCDLIAVRTQDARKVLESRKVDIVYGLEESPRSDMLHQRNSGLNHITCRLAAQKGVAVGFSLKSIISDNRVMGRVSQNIKLCRKYGVRTVIASFADHPFAMRAPQDLVSLFVTLGMSAKEARESLTEALRIIERKKREIVPGAEYV